MNYARILIALAVVGLFAMPAAADMYDEYWVAVDPQGLLIPDMSGGTGYADGDTQGQWYYYERTNWYNQWFYDGIFDPNRWKTVDIGFWVEPLESGVTSSIQYVINWTTPPWSEPGPTPTPPIPDAGYDPEQFIERSPVTDEIVIDKRMYIQDHFDIREYNPEWVSIDIRGVNFVIPERVQLPDGEVVPGGWIEHDCIPEPGVLTGLLGLGAMAGLVGIRRWRRRR